MFQQLHHYFFQYKTLGIPGVGTLHMVQQPASLDVANQQLLPPAQKVRFSRQVAVGAHQIQTLAYAFNNDKALVEEELTRFGEALRSRLQEQPFQWHGVGLLQLDGAYIHFEPMPPAETILLPVPAQRVLRENVQHTVLVGEQERQVSAEEYQAELVDAQPRRFWLVILAWLLALVALAFIVYHIYLYNWRPEATGLKQKFQVEQAPVQHH